MALGVVFLGLSSKEAYKYKHVVQKMVGQMDNLSFFKEKIV
jgi:hypothetical protein